jgi:hypothetical protein
MMRKLGLLLIICTFALGGIAGFLHWRDNGKPASTRKSSIGGIAGFFSAHGTCESASGRTLTLVMYHPYRESVHPLTTIFGEADSRACGSRLRL